MGDVIIVGAGIAGLGTALALGRQGQRVILCERDAAPVPATPEEMWSAWPRLGVAQTYLGHAFVPLTYVLLRDHAPDVLQRLREAGTVFVDAAAAMPGQERLPEDADLMAVHCRRPTLEGFLRQAVEAETSVEVRAGCAVAGLLAAPSSRPGMPHVVGIRTKSGEQIRGDAVVIAGGRLIPVRAWLEAIGAHPPEEVAEGTGTLWYTRHFRLLPHASEDAAVPLEVHDLSHVFFYMYQLDGGTFAVDLGVPHTVRELHALHAEAPFMAVARSIPLVAPWLSPERSVPIGPVAAMGQEQNILRHFISDGRPLALGLHVIGDARCQTHNAYGWGTPLALSDAVMLADALRHYPHDPLAQALCFEERTSARITSNHALALAQDRARLRVQRGEPAWDAAALEGSEDFLQTVVYPAAGEDATIFRAVTRRWSLLDSPDALARNTAVLDRARALAAVRQPPAEPPTPLGPSREELIQIVMATGQDQ
jgi:2-polyprenyl-6-methoxyphenol hydroxylase-like FAD-dependent oxidoreductase